MAEERISKTMIASMAVAAIATAIISVNVGMIIGNRMNQNYASSSSSLSPKIAVHPHLTERHLATINDPQQQLSFLLEKLSAVPAVADMAGFIPKTVAELQGMDDDVNSSPEVRAASWLIHKDTVDTEEFLIRRFALAYIYYNNGGVNWNNTLNWLSPTESHCTWHGVTCCKNFLFSPVCANITADPDGITELDLYNNNLVGTIPNTIALLTDVQSIFLSENWLTGKIPESGVFQNLPKLLKLYMQHNVLEGTIPNIHNGLLDTLFVQGNDLTGDWPSTFCDSSMSNPTSSLAYYGLDCNEIKCSAGCCSEWIHCFIHATKGSDTRRQ